MKRQRNIALAIAAAILVAGIGVVALSPRTSIGATDGEIPVGLVARRDLDMRVYLTGELRANRTMMLNAPPIGGGALQITRLVHTGVLVKKGDIVIEFDPSEQLYKLEQNRSELLQAEQEITKAKADAAVLASKDELALLKAHYDVRRAELDVQQNELKSSIDAQKNLLALAEAKRALAQLEQDIKSHTVSGQATIAVAQEKHNKSKLGMEEAQRNIEKMRVLSPMDGLISINKNRGAMGGFGEGVSVTDYREGDQVNPGSPIAQVIDATQMDLVAKVAEQDRSNIKVGQQAEIRLDALVGHTFKGTVKTVGGMSAREFWEGDAGGKFDVSIALTDADSGLRPGLTGEILILGDTQKNVLCIPRQALFLKDGKRIVYAKNGSGFEQREVKILSQNESRAAIEGVNAGTEVAMVDPTVARKASNAGTAQAATGGGTQ